MKIYRIISDRFHTEKAEANNFQQNNIPVYEEEDTNTTDTIPETTSKKKGRPKKKAPEIQ